MRVLNQGASMDEMQSRVRGRKAKACKRCGAGITGAKRYCGPCRADRAGETRADYQRRKRREQP